MDKHEPTDRQIKFAEEIADALDIKLPRGVTKKAYSDFKSEWTDEINKELDRLLQKLEPTNRVKVSDLPDAPEKNTVYTLEQEWIYLDNNWLRL